MSSDTNMLGLLPSCVFTGLTDELLGLTKLKIPQPHSCFSPNQLYLQQLWLFFVIWMVHLFYHYRWKRSKTVSHRLGRWVDLTFARKTGTSVCNSDPKKTKRVNSGVGLNGRKIENVCSSRRWHYFGKPPWHLHPYKFRLQCNKHFWIKSSLGHFR